MIDMRCGRRKTGEMKAAFPLACTCRRKAPAGAELPQLQATGQEKGGLLFMDEYGSDWPIVRKQAVRRDNGQCVFCRSTDHLHVHHIRPLLRGGLNILWNLITLCRGCHHQAHRDIREHGLSTIPGPYYEEHWSQLTDETDVLRYADHLDAIGIGGDYVRSRER